MVWFSEDMLPQASIFSNMLAVLEHTPLSSATAGADLDADQAELQKNCCDVIRSMFEKDGLMHKLLDYSLELEHCMETTRGPWRRSRSARLSPPSRSPPRTPGGDSASHSSPSPPEPRIFWRFSEPAPTSTDLSARRPKS